MKPLQEARRQQRRFQGAAVQIAAIMRFVDEQIAEGITDEHDLANRAIDWYGNACDDWAKTRVVQHASGQQTLPHFTRLADYLVRAIAAAMLMRIDSAKTDSAMSTARLDRDGEIKRRRLDMSS